MLALDPKSLFGSEISADLFGGNMLSSRDQVGEDGSFDEIADELGIEHIRFPGGTITERTFDITDPDNTEAFSPSGNPMELTPLSEALGFASEEKLGVTIVLPTRTFLSDDTDVNGDRYPEFDQEDLRAFVRDVLNGTYGDARIEAFEIGNEYYYSGEMSSVEYARLASEMTSVVKSEVDAVVSDPEDTPAPKILVQTGYSYGYASLEDDFDYLVNGEQQIRAAAEMYGIEVNASDFVFGSGEPNWMLFSKQLVLSEFVDSGAINEIDGVVAHVYSKEPTIPNSADRGLKMIERTWLEEREDLELHVTEWNQKASTSAFEGDEDYGLLQAQELLHLMDIMSEYEVEQAHVWAIQHNTRTALSLPDGELSPAGEMYKMMSENLQGLTPIKFFSTETSEGEETPYDLHSYWADSRLVMYLASNSEDPTSNLVDVSALIESVDSVEVTVLGVADGELPGSTSSEPVVEELVPGEVYSDGIIDALLDSHEIMQIVFEGVQLTDDAAAALNADVPIADDAVVEIPMVDPEDWADDTTGDVDEGGGGEDTFGMDWVLALLPLLGLAAAAF